MLDRRGTLLVALLTLTRPDVRAAASGCGPCRHRTKRGRCRRDHHGKACRFTGCHVCHLGRCTVQPDGTDCSAFLDIGATCFHGMCGFAD